MFPFKKQFLFALALLAPFICQMQLRAREPQAIPLKAQVTHVQPMAGIVLWSDNDEARKHADAITLESLYCGYNDMVNERGKPIR